MIDNIIRIEDLKNLIEKQNLDMSDLRICIMRQNLENYFFSAKVILTIPKNKETILQCEIARKIFNSAFMDMQNSKEYKDFKQWTKKAYDKVHEHFGNDIIEGNWIEK